MKYERELPTRRPIPVRVARLERGLRGLPARQGAHAGRALHGLRHPVLPHRLPAREPHPRVERPRVPRRLAAPRASGCTRPTTSPSSPGRLCPAPCEAACVLGINEPPVTIKQIEVEIVDRAWDEGWLAPVIVARAKTGKRVAVVGIGPGRARGRAAADARRPRRHRLRARRPHRRAAALRHPRVQDGEAPPRPAHRADGGRGHAVPRRTPTWARTCPVERARATATRSCSPAAPPRGATCRFPGASSTGIYQAMEYLPPSQPRAGGRPRRVADHARRASTS